jgi:hypothetical protein
VKKEEWQPHQNLSVLHGARNAGGVAHSKKNVFTKYFNVK